MDFDPRDLDSRDEERFAPSRDRDDRGTLARDLDHDEWSRQPADHRDRDYEMPGRDRERDDSRESLEAERYRDSRDDLRSPEHDRDDRTRDTDPRDVFTRHLDLPRGLERERVRDRDREYTLRGSESRTLAAVGAFRGAHSSSVAQSGFSCFRGSSARVGGGGGRGGRGHRGGLAEEMLR